MPRQPRIGILTGGGDCPGLNAVIRAVTKSLIREHDARVIGFEDGFEGLIERRCRELRFDDVSGILTLGGTILGASNKANPFEVDGKDVSDAVIGYYNELDLDALVSIGGDGTMSISHALSKKGMRIVGVPKTIDNDVAGTDRSFGFDTAVSIASEAIDRLHTTAQSHNRIMIIETMGRYAGWIALYAGVASGSDIILLPECEYEIDEIVRVCFERKRAGRRFTIIAVAEGAKPEGGDLAIRETIEESTDPVRLGGICQILANQLKDHVPNEVRTTILGHVQRGGTPTSYDRVLSTGFGSAAAALVVNGQFGRMVALREGKITSVPLEEVAERVRTVPPDLPLLAAALGIGTSFGVRELQLGLDRSKGRMS